MAQPIQLPIAAAPTSAVETVTPELAREYLGANSHNRNIRRNVIAAYARDMEANRWHFTGEPIKFAADGTLLDGQHRLHAIVAAETPVPLLVVRGLSRTAQDAMDTGAKRTTGDALSLHGEKHSKLLSTVATMILTDIGRVSRVCTTGEVMALLDSEPFLRTICAELLPAMRCQQITASAQAYCYWRIDKVSPNHAAEFFTSLATLTNLPHKSPVLALHQRLSNLGSDASARGRAYQQQVVAYVFMAWNAWAKGEDRSIIKLAIANGRLSIPEPVPLKFF